jgi:hypothetical protein
MEHTLYDFPKLIHPQVTLVHAEFDAGIVLDLTFRRAQGRAKVFLTFSSLEEASSYAQQLIDANSKFECVIYDHHGDGIKVFRPPLER